MNKIELYYKTDFSAILQFDGGWTVPFRLNFYTGSPSHGFIASHDGKGNYTNCHLESDGRLCIGFDNHKLTMGVLKMQPTFYLDNTCYESNICDEEIAPFIPTFIDEEGEEYQLQLSMTGESTMRVIGTLPPFYQKGDPGKSFTWDDLTPEQKAELKGEPGYTPQKGVDYFDGKDGDPGAPGAPGKDGRDGGLIYPSYKVDPHNMHLYSDTDTNRVALSKDKHFTVKF